MESRKMVFRFLLPIVLISLCIPLDSIDVFDAVFRYGIQTDVHYFWLNSIIYGGIYGSSFINVLAALPHADSFCQDYEQGLWRYLIARGTTGRYVARKLGKVFFTSGLVACLGGGLFICGAATIMPLFDNARYIEVVFLPFCELLKECPVQYFIIMLYLLFLSGGFWSSISWCFSVYIPVRYLVYLFPFMGAFLLTRVNTLMQLPLEWRLDFMLKGRAGASDYKEYLFVVSAEILLFTFFGGVMACKKIKRRLSNE